MSAPLLADAGDPVPRREPAAGHIPQCRGGTHRWGGGALDETARRLSHEELAVATRLAVEGHQVRSLPERPGRGPVADLAVCGSPVEVKSFLSLAERAGRIPTARSVCNKLLGARAQAPTTVLYACGSGLDAPTAAAGIAEFGARGRPGRITAVRVVGDGFDLAWRSGWARAVATDGRRRGASSPARSRDVDRPGPGLGR